GRGQGVGELVPGIVGRRRAAGVGDHDGVGHRAAVPEITTHGLGGGQYGSPDPEDGGIGRAADARVVGRDGGVVYAVVVVVERDGALVADRRALGPAVDGRGDGDGDAAAERRQRTVPIDGIAGGCRRARRGGGADQGQPGRQGVGEFMTGVV